MVYLLLETLLIHYVGLWLASAREEGERQRLEAPKECGKAVRRKALGRRRLIFAFGVLTLIGILLVLLVPYIMHYYLLENETQKMYDQYDRILKQVNKKDTDDWD